MNGFLFDTNIVIWAVNESERLTYSLRARLESRPIFVSQVTLWEIAIKLSGGKLVMPPIFTTDFEAAVSELSHDLRATLLPMSVDDFARLSRLPFIHRDPFDRLMICQAVGRGLTLVTGDRVFGAYAGLDLLEI